MKFRIFDYLDQSLITVENRESRASRTPAVWPSEASAIRNDQSVWPIVGGCHRRAIYRMLAFPTTNKIDAIGGWRFRTGRLIEAEATDLAKRSAPRVFAASGVKLYVKDFYLPFELDLVVIDPKTGRGYIVECKTNYGYGAREMVKNRKPKDENILQASIYLNEIKTGKRLKELIYESLHERMRLDSFKEAMEMQGKFFDHRYRTEADLSVVEKMDDGPVGCKLIYISRDECDRFEFDIDREQQVDGSHEPTIDDGNGPMTYPLFTIESIYERFHTLQNYWFVMRQECVRRLAAKKMDPPETLQLVLTRGDVGRQYGEGPALTKEQREAETVYMAALEEEMRKLPDEFFPRPEYQWSYEPDKIEYMHNRKLISDHKYKNWCLGQKGSKAKTAVQHLGDWQCAYCPYRSLCIPVQRPDLSFQVADLMSAEEEEVTIGSENAA